jgi:hypothetical protein
VSSPSDQVAEPGSSAAELRHVASTFLRHVAESSGEEYTGSWAWNSVGMWIPPEDPHDAADEADELFGDCTADDPMTVEVLWKHWHDAAPAWYRVQIAEAHLDSRRPWLRGMWANPETGMMVLSDIAAVCQTVGLLPLSCVDTDRADFEPTFMRPATPPADLLPQVEMTAGEADQLIAMYLHRESHRVGPLWTTIDAQAAATRNRLFQIVATYGAAGTRTDVNVAVAVCDTAVPCPVHSFDPLPSYVDANDERVVGLHAVAHAHQDGSVGLEKGGSERLRAVLTCVALYGGSVHLATFPPDEADVPLAEETLYRVHFDWRAERVEDAEDRQIRHLNWLIENRPGWH